VIDGTPEECRRCKGRGSIAEVHEVGPGIMTQMQRPCGACKGQGQQCAYKSQRKVLEVRVEPGAKNGDKITFRGMSDEIPNMETGDIHFVIQEKSHELFSRKGADLLIVKDVTLKEALCGLTFEMKHLDGRVLVVKSRPGEVIQPQTNAKETLPFVKVLFDEGFPSKGNPFERGNLYIMFRIQFPRDNELPQNVIAELKKLLPGADEPEEYDPMEVEEVDMSPGDFRDFGKGGVCHSGSKVYDSDDEGGAQPVQCQQS